MNIKYQALNFSSDENTQAYVEKKLSKLSQFYDKIISIDVSLKIENSHDNNNKLTEVKLEIPGNTLVVKKLGSSFEESIDLAEEAAKKLIKRTKDKLTS